MRLAEIFAELEEGGAAGFEIRGIFILPVVGDAVDPEPVAHVGAELGAGVRLGKLLVSAGYVTLPFSYNALSVSVGYSFGR